MNLGEELSRLVKGGLLPNHVTFIAQLISTIILFWAIKKFVWVKMQQFLETRKEVIVGELESAKQARLEAESMRQEYEHDLKEAKIEAGKIIENARLQALETKQEIITKAENEAAYQKDKALKELEAERSKVEAELKSQVIDIAFIAAEKLVNENLDDKRNRQLIDHFIKEVGE